MQGHGSDEQIMRADTIPGLLKIGRRPSEASRRARRFSDQLRSALDCTKLMLLSSKAREAAHSFFRRCGFTSDTKHAFVKYRSHFNRAD
jgi:hypothetical protein